MMQESHGFGAREVDEFFAEFRAHERAQLLARLEAVALAMESIARAFPAPKPALPGLVEASQDRSSKGSSKRGSKKGVGGAARQWEPLQVLAHMAVVARFYGSLVYQVANGRVEEVDFVSIVSARDGASASLEGIPAAELVAMSAVAMRRTVAALRSLDATAWSRLCRTSTGTVDVEQLLRYTLVGHLEIHLAQLRAALQEA